MSKKQDMTGAAAYRRLLDYMRGYRRFLIIAFVGMVVYAFAEMQMARFVQVLLDDAFGAENADIVKRILIFLMLIILGRAGGSFVSTYFMSLVSRGVIKKLRSDMFAKLLHLPISYYDKSSTGEVIASFSFNVEQVAESTCAVIKTSVEDTLLVIFLVGLLFMTNARLAMVLFVLVPVAAMVIYTISFRFRKVSRRIQQSIGRVTHIVNETVDGHQVVKIFGGEDRESTTFSEANQHNYKQNVKLIFVKAASTAFIQFSAGLALIVVIYLAISGWVGDVSQGVFAEFLVAMARMSPPLKHLTGINVQLQRGIAAALSIFEMLDEAEEPDQGRRRLQRAKGDLQYRSVNFSYDTSKGKVLSDVSFDIKAGETIALVGRSGSGKSTIVKLLPRFYELQSGEIKLDGININDYRLHDLRGQIAFVSQHVTLFNDTIANNIAYGRLGEKTSREQIVQAAKAAHVMDFVQKLPDGLDTKVGEDGVLLSGGQRQRLAIARAILRNAPILVLDEATSALDTESEQKIQAALDNLIKNKTTIVIAHRLSTVENADRILVLDNGEVTESGTHKELLAKDQQYASLYKLQFNLGEPTTTMVTKLEQDELVDYPIAGQDFIADTKQPTIWERLWYGYHPFAQLLAPVGYVFNILVSIRRWLYKVGIFKTKRTAVPLIVIGNVTVGGTGKTPLVIWLANYLSSKGYRPGIISRGYKGKSKKWPLLVTEESDAEQAGDEATMVVKRTKCPMVIGPDRGKDIELLLNHYPCDVVISDDGLQHYAMGRDIEVIVADGSRGFGNGMLLPAGPMREPKSRVRQADYIITNGARLPNTYPMKVTGDTLYALTEDRQEKLDNWVGYRVHAVAAIGNPERFFDLLRNAGISVVEHVFEDHHAYTPQDIDFNDDLPIVMTEKDAVKCKDLVRADQAERFWYIPVDARLPSEFISKLEKHIASLVDAKKAA